MSAVGKISTGKGGHKTYLLVGGPFSGQVRRVCGSVYQINPRHRRVIPGPNHLSGTYKSTGATGAFLGFTYPVMEWQG